MHSLAPVLFCYNWPLPIGNPLDILLQLLLIFIKVNLLSTSGPASVGLLYHEVVGNHVTEAQFVQAVGLSSVLPGSDALQLAMYIGYAVGGVPGGLVALAGSILPPTIILLGVTMVLHRLRREAWLSNFVEGLAPAISVLMLFTAWKIFQNGGSTGWIAWLIGVVSLAAMFMNAPARIVVILAGILGVYLFS
jgi:chromate transporter